MKTRSLTRQLLARSTPRSLSTNSIRYQQTATPTKSDASLRENEPAISSPVLRGVAKLMGFNSRASTAIRSTNYYYDRCSEQDRIDDAFWYTECGLPHSFQSWFQITNLHVWLLTTRFRALPSPLGRYFCQEIINHLFVDAEHRMQTTYEITQGRLVKGYLRDMLGQHRGSVLAFDEALSGTDAVLAAALWRNVFGAAWGKGMGGILQRAYDLPASDPSKVPKDQFQPSGTIDVAPQKADQTPEQIVINEAQFATTVATLVDYVRSELHRLDSLSDEVIARGRTAGEVLAPPVQFRRLSEPSASNLKQ